MVQLEFEEKIYDMIHHNIKKYWKLQKIPSAKLAEIVDLSHDFIRQIQSDKTEYHFPVETFYKISVAQNGHGNRADEIICYSPA